MTAGVIAGLSLNAERVFDLTARDSALSTGLATDDISKLTVRFVPGPRPGLTTEEVSELTRGLTARLSAGKTTEQLLKLTARLGLGLNAGLNTELTAQEASKLTTGLTACLAAVLAAVLAGVLTTRLRGGRGGLPAVLGVETPRPPWGEHGERRSAGGAGTRHGGLSLDHPGEAAVAAMSFAGC